MRTNIALVAAVVLAAACAAFGQNAPKPSGGPRGDLTAIDAAQGILTIKTLEGAEAKARLSPQTEFLLVDAGAKSLAGAERISIEDVKVGDRVWARGEAGADGVTAARQVVVMSAQSIAERNRQDAMDWRRRGMMGEVRAVDPAARQITVESYRGDQIAVDVSDATVLRRLREGATDLSNSESITLADVQAGNQIAVRGERAPDGTKMSAETLLVGRFPRPMRGRVTAVDQASGAVTISTMQGQTLALEVPSGALVRKLNPPPARPDGAGPGAGGPGAGGERREGAPAGPGAGRPGGPGGPDAGPRRGPGGFAFALGDRTELDRRTTEIPLSEVAPGDFVFAVVEPGTTARVKVLVKFEVPADRAPRDRRGPGMQGPPSMDMGGDDDLPF